MKLTILSTSDVHGYLYPTNYSQRKDQRNYGLLKAAAKIKQLKQQAASDEWVITIENGDFIQGSPLTYYTAKKQARWRPIYTQLTNAIGYDAGILGNHEFNYGQTYLAECEQGRHYPILAANVQQPLGADIIDAPYQILTKNGVKVGILGLTTAYIPHWEETDHIFGWQFKSAVQAAKKWVPRLRKLVDIVIVAYHGGFERDLQTGDASERQTGENEGYQLLAEVPGIDALVTGHQHREIATICQGVPVTQPADKAQFIGAITLELNEKRQVCQQWARLLSLKSTPPDRQLLELTQGLQDEVEDWLDQPVGQIAGNMRITDPMQARMAGHPYLTFVNQVQMAATKTDLSATALFNDEVLGYEALVSMRNIVNSYVYPNTLVVLKITGADLKQALERCASFFTLNSAQQIEVAAKFREPKLQYYNYDIYSGINYAFDLRKPVGQRLLALSYHGQPVLDAQPLEIALNQYRGVGGGDYPMFSAAKIIREVPIDMTELISDYFAHHPIVTAIQENNFRLKK
ncbi:bifunctional metallophosphatase/5'-nucleotidase [Pediococcus siamensis]|uniref:bifunctional metallophosphatase/5'-nucleotidase n=1 Tax=Pediococcus siamensis TaxID=381829 RepID=UPI0039A2C840